MPKYLNYYADVILQCEFSTFFAFYTAGDRWDNCGNCRGGSQCDVASSFYLCKFASKRHSSKRLPRHFLPQSYSSGSQFFRPNPNLGRALKAGKGFKNNSKSLDMVRWRHLYLGVDWTKRLLQGCLIVVGASHMLQNSLPSVDRVVTVEALVDQAFRVLPFYVAPNIRRILRLVATEFANNQFFAFFIKCSAHEGFYLLKNS